MPQLAKGGKWVFGWVVVGPQREIRIPPEAYAEYGFQAGEPVFFLAGSRTSGGFGIMRKARIADSAIPLERRALADGMIGERGVVRLPAETGMEPGDRLLAARGSGLALGFLSQGPILEEAKRHPEVECFTLAEEPRG